MWPKHCCILGLTTFVFLGNCNTKMQWAELLGILCLILDHRCYCLTDYSFGLETSSFYSFLVSLFPLCSVHMWVHPWGHWYESVQVLSKCLMGYRPVLTLVSGVWREKKCWDSPYNKFLGKMSYTKNQIMVRAMLWISDVFQISRHCGYFTMKWLWNAYKLMRMRRRLARRCQVI